MIEVLKSKRVRDIACGSSHSAAITSNGELYTWGLGDYGRLGHGDNTTQLKPKLVSQLLFRCSEPWPDCVLKFIVYAPSSFRSYASHSFLLYFLLDDNDNLNKDGIEMGIYPNYFGSESVSQAWKL